MTLTLPKIPDELGLALHARARQEGKTAEQLAAEILCAQLLPVVASRQRDLGEFAGSWIDDPAVTSALHDQDQIDPELWT